MAEEKPNLRLVRIYLKDVSFESPSAPEAFKIKAEPAIDLAIRVAVRPLSANHYEVVLTGSITARAEGLTLFLCEAQQAGVFLARGYEGAELDQKLNVFCPKQLFPFLREALASLTMKGGFPPVQIALVDFDDLYRSRQPQAAQA
jgi:preprotein translocase subunit SecB